MSSNPQFSILSSVSQPAFEQFYAIYVEALPRSEQKRRIQLERMLQREDYIFLVVHDKDQLRGFAIAYLSEAYPFYLLEYMAVEAAQRNKGYGELLYHALYSAVAARTGTSPSVLIEVDSPDEYSEDQAIRQRRVGFYQRCGAQIVPCLDYLLPMDEAGAPPAMRLMIAGPQPSKVEMGRWLEDVFLHVYNKTKQDSRLQMMCRQLSESV